MWSWVISTWQQFNKEQYCWALPDDIGARCQSKWRERREEGGKKNRSSHIKHVPVEIQPLSVSVSLAAEKIMTLGSIFKRRISLFIFSFFFQYDTSMSCAFFWQFIYTLYFLGETFLNSHCSCFVLVATLALIGACAYRHLCIIL